MSENEKKTGNETGFTYNAMGSLIDGYFAWIDNLDVLKNAPDLPSGIGILNACEVRVKRDFCRLSLRKTMSV